MQISFRLLHEYESNLYQKKKEIVLLSLAGLA